MDTAGWSSYLYKVPMKKFEPLSTPHMKELDRLRTFFEPKPFPWVETPSPTAIARAGFYYTGNGDSCTCAFCCGSLEKWELHDDPVILHRLYFPHCPFVKGQYVGNIPILLDPYLDVRGNNELEKPEILDLIDMKILKRNNEIVFKLTVNNTEKEFIIYKM
ncbi:hypothetical protein B4U80_01259 [Leptotrombidium deliense]|uniref:Uncharacterized protein n=1 Tax=Leptotrombidium deliense TaxID=299467 RepID=A0A443RU31_9ACAR|nr:hypothetical protein B4U80_01259 [Leptotrombidium deliense]